MKIIDLLNKIANDEETPPLKIKYKNKKYFYDDIHDDYNTFETGNYEYLLYEIDLASLNDEIEIIEEDKKIEKLENYISCGWNGTCKDLSREELFNMMKKTGDKINEIIDYINKGDK